MTEGNRRLKLVSYYLIVFSFLIIWSDWSLLIINYKYDVSGNDGCNERLIVFGAGSLFGYVPFLSGIATLKRHEARRALLLTTIISSCILAAYDVSEGLGRLKTDCKTSRALGVILLLQAILSCITTFISAFGWFSLNLSQRLDRSEVPPDANDSPPDYDQATRESDSISFYISDAAHRAYYKVKNCLHHSLFTSKLTIPSANLERISMSISIFTIVIIISQVVEEVLRLISSDRKCYALDPEDNNSTIAVWCNPEIDISCVPGFGYFLTMPAFFILILGVQFRTTRAGLTIGGYAGLELAIFSALTFLTLTALAMIDFVSFIGVLWFNGKELANETCHYIIYAVEVVIVVQAFLAIAGAALALVSAYIIISNFLDKYSDTVSPSRQLHREVAAENHAQINESFAMEEETSNYIDPKLPSYQHITHVALRHNSLPNLSNLNRYGHLPNLNLERHSNSINSLRNLDSPPQYRKEEY